MNSDSLILTLLKLKGWGSKKVYDYVYKNEFNYEMCVSSLANELSLEEKNQFKFELLKTKMLIDNNQRKGVSIITLLDKEFPKKLYQGTDKCVRLFYMGDISLLNQKSILIIGTRKPDDEFVEKGKIVTKYYAEKGYVVVSGLALGCDTVAHTSCLEVNGKTIAVLPSSCDKIQPISNKTLAEKIIQNGGLLISEYDTDTPYNKFNFAQRDKIQSLLVSAIIVIQSSDTGGTMIAVKKSLKDFKKVFAIKGNDITLLDRYIDPTNLNDLKEVEDYIYF